MGEKDSEDRGKMRKKWDSENGTKESLTTFDLFVSLIVYPVERGKTPNCVEIRVKDSRTLSRSMEPFEKRPIS